MAALPLIRTAALQLPASLRAALQGPKSSSAEACLAPPGIGYYTRGLLAGFEPPAPSEGTEPATLPCPIGFYKSGWNREACHPCGLNMLTPAAGSDSSDACYIPAGWGSKMADSNDSSTLTAFKCVNGTYGVSMPHFGLLPAPCQVGCVACLYACHTIHACRNVQTTRQERARRPTV
jgi:hypothetical protein